MVRPWLGRRSIEEERGAWAGLGQKERDEGGDTQAWEKDGLGRPNSRRRFFLFIFQTNFKMQFPTHFQIEFESNIFAQNHTSPA